VMVSPMGCLGEPHEACLERGIPIVVVRENKSVLHEYEDGDERFIFVENYLEAAGLVMAMQAGIHPSSVRRPLGPTSVLSAGIDGSRVNARPGEDKGERRYETAVEIPERRTD